MTTEELEALARRLAYSDGCGPHPDHGACEANHKHMREILQALKDVRRETLEEVAKIIQRFIDTRGRHEGNHRYDETVSSCLNCDAAYIDAEAVLDRDLRAIRSKLEQEKV